MFMLSVSGSQALSQMTQSFQIYQLQSFSIFTCKAIRDFFSCVAFLRHFSTLVDYNFKFCYNLKANFNFRQRYSNFIT